MASRHESIHSCQFWWIVSQRQLQFQLAYVESSLLGIDFPMWRVAADVTVLLKQNMSRDKFDFLEIFSIFDSSFLARPINIITLPSSRSQKNRLVSNLVVSLPFLNNYEQIIGAIWRFCLFSRCLCWLCQFW